MSNKFALRSTFVALLLLSASGVSSAQIAVTNSSNVQQVSSFSKFTPRPQNKTRIDYDVWNGLLEEMVLYTGPSARIRMPRPKPVTGSRFIRGHSSPYRLEGNRIPYSEMKPAFKTIIKEYRQDLERIGTNIDISKLPKNEQLAFWFNLHNATIIDQLAEEYPVRRPGKLKVGNPRTLLHDAKIINIRNEQLSLRDIREKIVYPNWKNPKVIYGFYLGDIGSPTIQNTAFNAENISDLLDRTADEFVNSLRGFYVRNDKQYISRLYTDVSQFYFPDFNTDIATHMKKFMRDDVKSKLRTSIPFSTGRYDPIIADLTAGQGSFSSISQLETTNADGVQVSARNTIQKFAGELIIKRQALERQGLVRNGTVIIEDIETVDPDSIVKPDIE